MDNPRPTGLLHFRVANPIVILLLGAESIGLQGSGLIDGRLASFTYAGGATVNFWVLQSSECEGLHRAFLPWAALTPH